MAGSLGSPEAAPRVPAGVAATLEAVHGARGQAWLAGYPALLRAVAARWDLAVGEPFADLTFNMVLRVRRRDGTPAVLKLGPPCRELDTEAAALALYDGRGAVRLLEADTGAGALLLERVEPGRTLAPLALGRRDDAATAIAADVMLRLRPPVPAGAPFPTIADWFADLSDMRAQPGGHPLPPVLVEAAEATYAELAAKAAPAVVLHGDLHHGNVLDAGGGAWLAIDPKGVAGEPACEAGALLRNPVPGIERASDLARLTARRLDVLAERLGEDRRRIKGWAFAQAVLSACWALEEGPGADWRPWIAVAEVLGAKGT